VLDGVLVVVNMYLGWSCWTRILQERALPVFSRPVSRWNQERKFPCSFDDREHGNGNEIIKLAFPKTFLSYLYMH